MATGKIAVSGKLVGMPVGINDNPFHGRAQLARQNFRHTMRRFAKRNRHYTAVRFEVIQVIAHAQHAALVMHLAVKSFFNAGFGESVKKDLARRGAHAVRN
jgi:hypothetical protein